MRSTLLLCSCALLAAVASAQNAAPAPDAADPWAAVRFLEGEWRGSAEGEPGTGTVRRSYQFVLGARYLHERNVSSYDPKEAATPPEVHEHWSFLSYDRQRQRLVLRQFHQEGFVNQYIQVLEATTPQRIVFESEAIENIPSGWRARESYDLTGPDTFTETFELAAPGQEFAVYSKSSLRREGKP